MDEEEEKKRRELLARQQAPAATAPLVPAPGSGMGMVPIDSTTETNSGGRKTTNLSARAEAANLERQGAIKSEGLAEKNVLLAETKALNAENAALDQEQAIRAQQAVERQALKEAQQQARQQEHAKLTAMEEKHAGRKVEDFWRDKTTGQKVVAALAIAMGALDRGRSGGENTALKMLDSAIDRDIQLQKDDIERNATYIEKRRGGLGAADAYRSDALKELEIKHSKALEGLSLKARQMGNLAKSDQIKAKADALEARFGTKAAEIKDELAQKTNIEVDARTATSTTMGIKAAPGAAKGPDLDAEFGAKDLGRAQEIMKNPEVLKEWQRAATEQLESDALKEGKTVGEFIKLGRGFGANSTIEQRFEGPHAEAARELNRLFATAEVKQARVTDPVGAINEDVRKDARGRLGLLKGSPEEVINTLESFREKELAKAAQARAPQAVAKPGASATKPEGGRPFTYKGKHGTLYPNGKFVVDQP